MAGAPFASIRFRTAGIPTRPGLPSACETNVRQADSGYNQANAAALRAKVPSRTGKRPEAVAFFTRSGRSKRPITEMPTPLFTTLALAALTGGPLHSRAPDHWVPFAALARAQGWSAGRTARITFCCGLGHVTVSVAAGLLGLVFGIELLAAFGRLMEAVAGLLLIGFGLAYAIWGLRGTAGRHLHGHTHVHYDHVHEPARMTAWSLFLLFSADPCVAVVPLLFAAAPLGVASTAAIVVLYEAATIITMIVLVLPARAGARVIRAPWLDRYGHVAAGAVIVFVGLAVAGLGW